MSPTISANPSPEAQELPTTVVPFVRAATEINEPAQLDVSRALGAAQQVGPEDVPARGYLASLLILVEATGGAAGLATVAYKEDAPWSVISELALTDVNGGTIVGPISGYELFLINKWGGYAAFDDPTLSPAYVAPSSAGNFSFLVRVPVLINSRDGLGALGNQDSSQTYKLRINQGASTDVYATAPDTLPTVRYRAWLEAYSVPSPTNALGQPQAVQPPAHGTVQYWTKTVLNVASGQQTLRLPRVGNLIRAIIVIARTTAPARSTSMIPDPVQLFWDSRFVFNEARAIRRHYMYERYGHASLDTGVAVWDFAHDFDGRMGAELRDGYLPTMQSTRLELQGSFGSAGTLTVLTNDIAPQGDIYVG